MRLRPLYRHAPLVLSLLLFGTLPATPAWGQTEGGGGPQAEPAPAPDEPMTIRFTFKGATFEQVVDFFGRASGLPVIWETDAPEGTLDYLSPESYELAEALRVLNIILQSKGVMLRLSNDMLYLQKLTEMQREDIPTYIGTVPAEITGDQMVTVVLPLDMAVAEPLAEKLATMVATYGAVAALPQQNALVITETAAQVRRLIGIVQELDREDPEGAVEVIPIRYARATVLMEPLRALLSRTVERLVMDKNNKPKKVTEQEMAGLNITADDRTNVIVAKGVQNRIDKLKEAIALLDQPATGQDRAMRSFTLLRIAPAEAAATLGKAYERLPEEERPTVIPLDDLGKVTVIGPMSAIEEAHQLLAEVDGLEDDTGIAGDAEPVISVLAIEQGDPQAIIDAVGRLLNRRQQVVVKLLIGPDAHSIIVAGPARDVATVRGVVPVLDVPRRVDRRVRMLRLTAIDPAATVARARALYDREVAASGRQEDAALVLDVDLDEASRTLTMIGASDALDRFATALRTIESNTIVDRETRQISLSHAKASRVAGSLGALARQLLEPRDGAALVAPDIEAVDALDLLIITAQPEQFAVIGQLITALDEPDPSDFGFRVLPLAGVDDVDTLVTRTRLAYARLTLGYDADEMPAPDVEHDTLSGNLIVSGRTAAVQLYEQALGEARRLMPPSRTGRLLPLSQANAADVREPLLDLWRKTSASSGRAVPDPEIGVVERTNSLYVVAEPTQHAVIERYVRELDTLEPTALPPLRLLQVRAADSAQIAAMLRKRYDARPPEQRREQPVTIDADAGTNTLIVTAHEDVFAEISEFVEGVNRTGETGAERETMIFPLKGARAVDLAAALEKLYPDPPMPLDRRGRPMPDLRKPRDVYVSADAATNTLIVEAPAERRQSFEALVEQLDRVELPPTAELRTYHIERGDPSLIARTLTDLARRGVMSEQPADGSKPVEVLVQAEPQSRTLIVAGDRVTFEKTEAILEDLEVVPVQRSLRVFEVTGVDPQALSDRAMRLYAEQIADIPGAQPVSVDVDRDRGTIMAVAEDEAMFRFAGIVNELQQTVGPPPDVRLVALDYASATDVVAYLRDLADSHLALVGSRAGPPPMFEAIERTNSVLVAGQREHHDIVGALIDELDRMEPKAMPPLRILQLRTADATNLASALTRQYDQRPVEERNEKPVRISADLQTNALIIAAHPDVLPEIQSIVEDLNTTNRVGTEGREIRIFPLKVARAEDLARTLDEMFPEPPVPIDSRGRPLRQLQGPPEVVVRADPQTNSIIVDAPIQRMAGFEQLVEQLDRAKIAEETEIRTYQVVHARIDALAQTLRQLAQAGTLATSGQDRRVPIIVESEPVSQTLIVSGPADIFERVERVLGELDVKRSGPTTALRFFRLEYARADAVAPMLREILLARIVEDVPDAGTNVAALLNVTADRKTNTLIISAPESILPVAEQLVDQLDDGAAKLADPVVRIRPLTFADARDVSTALSGAVASMVSVVTGEPVEVKLIPSPGANAIVLVGLAEDLEAVEALIEPLDARPGMDAIAARTFKLTHADAAQIAKTVENLLTDQLATDPRIIIERMRRSRGQVDLEPRIRVEADDRTNSLIVSGPQQTVALAETLIKELDGPDESAEKTYATYTAQSADPARLAAGVQRVIDATRPAARRGQLELIAEPQSGAVVVIGGPDDVEEALDLLRRRDAETLAPPQMDLQILALEHAAADVTARTVGPLLRDRARWPRSLQLAAQSGVSISEPTVTADAAQNRLLISAPRELMDMARGLVGELDRARAGDAAVDVRVINLRQADAEGVATVIRASMAARAQRQPGVRPATVTAEPSTGSLIVTAVPEQIEEIEAIVARLDQGAPSDQIQVRTVFLKHARADAVAPIVKELLTGEEIPLWTRAQFLSRRMELPDTGPVVRVAADERLNAVVISATPTVLNVAEEMVVQLDVDQGDTGGRTRSVRVLRVENADASELATNIGALFDEGDASEAPPTLRVDRVSNSLLVRATDAQFATIGELVAAIDEATVTTSRQMQLIPIDASKASAAEVARTLQRLLDRAGGSSVEVISLEDLLRRRERERGEPVGALPAPPARDVRVALGRAVAAAALAADPAADPADDPADDAVEDADRGLTIAVDPATNSLIVIGAPRAIERVAALARQVQDQLPGEPGRVRYIALPPAVAAADLSQVIGQTLRRLTPGGGKPGDIARRATVIADPSANALIVTCNDSDFEVIGDLIAAVAHPPAPEPIVVKVYPLEMILADRAAMSVQQLIAPDGERVRGRQAQRVRTLAIKLLDGERSIDAVFDPSQITIAPDRETNSLLVRAPEPAIGFIDQFIELIDQTPANAQTTLKLYPLRHAKAVEIRNTLRQIFQARARGRTPAPGTRQVVAEFASDERTNTLLVTAAPEELIEVETLLRQLDDDSRREQYELRTIELAAALPSRAAELLEEIVIGTDQDRRASTQIVADDNSGVILVRAPDAVRAEIDAVLAEIDRDAAGEYAVRTLTLERADASAVAAAIQRFYDDRSRIASSGRGRREQARRISIIGDPASKTVLIAASDEDFEQIRDLVAKFDSPQATDVLSFRVFQLRHAKAADIEQAVNDLISDLTWNQGPSFFFGFGRFGGGRSQQQNQGTLAVRADQRLNALIATGEGDKFDMVEQLIEVLDAPPAAGDERLVRLYRVEHADLDIVADVVQELFTDSSRARRWWMPADPNEVKVRRDDRSNTLIVSATGKEHAEITELIEQIDGQVAPAGQRITVVPVEYADADEIARTLSRFLQDRARATGGPKPSATIIASESAGSLVISAADEELATLRDLLAQLDQPDVSGDRVIEIVVIEDGDADEIARIVREQFGRKGGQGVVVTADPRTNSLIINAPQRQFAQARALIEQLDAPPASDETIIRTYALDGAQADEAVRILSEALQLDRRGETTGVTIKLDPDSDAVEVNGKIVADRRSNSLIVTATAESFPVIESLIKQLDEVPAASPVEYRIIALEHAIADEVAFTLRRVGSWRDDAREPEFDWNRLENQLIVSATADQFEQIDQILEQIDRPSARRRTTDFVPLEFAEAQKVQEALEVFYGPFAFEADTPGKLNVRIVADPATNSLVISADEAEWADIRALLAKLDNEEYDSSLQLRVIPLLYADARSVADAINQAFQGQIERDRRGNGRDRPRGGGEGGRDDERREPVAPTVLVESEEWVRAAAERQTNSVIISASRKNVRKIQQIIGELDVADYAKLPPPRLIPVTSGDPERLAEALRRLYAPEDEDRGRQAIRIVGDQSSNTVIVRADEEEFRQISALAEAIQQEASEGGLSVHLVKLTSAPARRVAEAITPVYQAKAQQANQPLSIQVDAAGNSLVIASTAALFAQIRATVEQLDELAPAAGQGIFIIELKNITPDAAREIIETIGLHEPPGDDAVSRLVTEPITIAPMPGRNAVIVLANPIDRETIVGLLKAVDAEPALAEARMLVVKLENAEAGALEQVLRDVLSPAEQQANTPLARAVQEQVRRLSVRREGLHEGDLALDLTEPIRVIANEPLNALIVSSTPENVEAVAELIAMFDTLPVTEAVTVQLFPLDNIAADEFLRIVTDLFEQGKALGEVPGTELRGVPAGAVGKALIDEIAITIDERTNTVIVAGKENAVAFVEVLTQRLDSDVAAGWVEPRLIPLKYADANDLAETLEAILVDGADDLPQSTPLQRQVGRLRLARLDQNGGKVLESDVFKPMTHLVIRPEPQLNAIVLVGTPVNLEVVSELVSMLDTQAASPDATVRIYPVENASASRLASIITSLFDQQVASKAIRPEDRVIVQADERTNAIIVTTSPRSFAVLEGLLATLDSEIAPDLREIRRIPVEHASAARLQDLVQNLMDARLERLRQIQPETAELERASIVADPRTNSLVVAAGNESFEVIKRLVADLDQTNLPDASLVQVLTLSKANIDRIAEIINAVMERRYADMPAELKASQKPLVMPDPRTNSLLVAANPEDLTAIEDLVARIEAAPSDPAVGLHVLALPPSVSAEVLAPRLDRLMQERQQSLGPGRQPSDTVSIQPDPIGNTLVVAASQENVGLVRDLIDVLVRAEADAVAGRGFEVMQLTKSRAPDVRDLLDELYVDQANRTRGANTVQLSTDDRTNSILVHAGQRDMQAIRELVAQLDGAKPAAVVEIKYIALESANALETVSLINNVLSGRGIGARTGSAQATVLKYLREIEEGGGPASEMETSAAIRESIMLTPDLRTNTIIVSAPRQSMGMIERMIMDLDASSTGAKSIRIFKLVNADATAMAQILTDLFNLRQGNNLLVLKPREGGGVPEGAAPTGGPEGFASGITGTDLTAVPDERQQLSLTVDSRTNSLLVSGTPTYLDLVEDVVQELDALEANEREVYVYQLRNAEALEVARVLGEFVREEQEKLVGTLSPDQLGSAARLLEREITIQGDEKSNTVLVSASPRYMDRVKNMIERLDVDPPQVLIQVMLAEVTLDDRSEWGVDLFAGGQVGSASVSGSYGLASALMPGLGVPSLAIAATDFDMLITALQAQGRVNVLSNPSVMAANNENARIQVGETIRVPENTAFTESGASNTGTIAEEIGIILDVTPSINPDGFVRLTVIPEISTLSQETTQINENFESPIITRRRAETTITVHDGQTIVIGGLIADRFERRDQKVPLLGDLPFIGALFRSEVEDSVTTELLIVLTPHVIESPTDFDRVDEVTESQIGRLTLPESIKRRLREGAFDLGGGIYDAKGNRIDLEAYEERDALDERERKKQQP